MSLIDTIKLVYHLCDAVSHGLQTIENLLLVLQLLGLR